MHVLVHGEPRYIKKKKMQKLSWVSEAFKGSCQPANGLLLSDGTAFDFCPLRPRPHLSTPLPCLLITVAATPPPRATLA